MATADSAHPGGGAAADHATTVSTPAQAADLWWATPRDAGPAEPPFTAFGHLGYGNLDLRVFWQTTWWVDISGTPHRLKTMSPDYRANVIAFVHQAAAGWWHHVLTCDTAETSLRVLVAPDDQATTVALAQLERLTVVDPVTWIDASPLMRRLHQLQHDDTRRDR